MPDIADEIAPLALAVFEAAKRARLTIATAESCTGGMVIAALTDIPGSSAVVDRGFVTYSNAAKQTMLAVRAETLEKHGAVSEKTAKEMALGALIHARTDLSVAITGIAGPGGGTPTKPVGLVWFAAASKQGRLEVTEKRFGDLGRAEIRRLSTAQALKMLLDLAKNPD